MSGFEDERIGVESLSEVSWHELKTLKAGREQPDL